MAPSPQMNWALAVGDVRAGFARHEFWRTFAANEIASRYRRSRLGQFWITLSVAIFIVVVGGLYRGIFNADSGTYFAYFGVGYVIWLLLSDTINRSCTIFTSNKVFLLQAATPVSVFVYQLVLAELYTFAHHLVILPPIFLYLGLWPGWDGILLSLAGLVLAVYVAFWVALALGVAALRYRDLAPIVQSFIRMAFFATPIIWLERDLGGWGNVINTLNPFRYFVTLTRSPLLGEPVPAADYVVSLGIAAFATLAGLSVLALTRTRITYWL